MVPASRSHDFFRRLRTLIPQLQESLSGPNPRFPEAELALLAQCGVLSAPLPERLGGFGFDSGSPEGPLILKLLTEIGRSNLATGRIFEGHVNALALIQHYGTAEQLKRAANDVIEQQCVFGVWNTGQPGQPRALTLPHGRYELEGGKTFGSGAGRIQRAIVTAELDKGGWQMFLLPLNRIEYTFDPSSWHPLGMEASDSYSVDFTGITVGSEDRVGEPAQYYAEPLFTAGAFRFAAVQFGGIQALYDFCRDYLRELHFDRDPIQQHRLGQMSVAIESGRQWIEQAGVWLERYANCPTCLVTRARMVRVAIHQICVDVMDMIEVSIGARGMLGGRPFARGLRDLRMYLRQAGHDAAVGAIGRAALEDELRDSD